jgi:hypothetical protein
MGQQFEALFRATIENERVKQMQNDITNGFKQISNNFETMIESIQSDPRVKEAEGRGREAVEQLQQSKIVHDMQEVLIQGITQVNERLRQVVERVQAVGEAPASEKSQDVPIEQEPPTSPPTTGETTKLDN